MVPNMAATFDAPRRILILLLFQLLFLSLCLHEDRILNTFSKTTFIWAQSTIDFFLAETWLCVLLVAAP